MAPPSWCCRVCGWQHVAAHSTCGAWCTKAPAATAAARGWVNYAARGRSRERERPKPKPKPQQRPAPITKAEVAAAPSAVDGRSWVEVVSRRPRAVSFKPQVEVPAAGAAATTRWRGGAWDSLVDSDNEEDEEGEEVQPAESTLLQEQHAQRAKDRAYFAAVRKTMADFPDRIEEQRDIERRIEALNREAHAAKPLGQRHKALETRLWRCELSQAKAETRVQAARLAQEVAAQELLDATLRVTELGREAAELAESVRLTAASIAQEDAAVMPATSMDIDVVDPCNIASWSEAHLEHILEQMRSRQITAPLSPLPSSNLPFAVSICTPTKTGSRAREQTPEGRATAECIEDSPPPAPVSGYGKANGRAVALASPYDDVRPALGAPLRSAVADNPDFHGGADTSGGSR